MAGNIVITLTGLITVSVNSARTKCTIGILKDPPQGHKLTINITEGGTTKPITPNPNSDLILDVQNTSQTGISFVDLDIGNRTDRTKNPTSSRWFANLENPSEFYNPPIGVKKAGLSLTLSLEKGELSTATNGISLDHLLVQRGLFADYVDFGFVALTIQILIKLDQGNSMAELKNGASFTFDRNKNYRMDIVHEGSPHPKVVTDANHYYKAVGPRITEAQRILFMSIDMTQRLDELLREAQSQNDTAREAALKKIQHRQHLDEILNQARANKDAALEAAVGAVIKALGPPAGPEAACFAAFLSESLPS